MTGRFSGLRRSVLDDRVDVAEAGVIGAGRDPRHRSGRSLALINRDIEIFGGKISLRLGPVIPGVDTLQFPIQREPDFDRFGSQAASCHRNRKTARKSKDRQQSAHGWFSVGSIVCQNICCAMFAGQPPAAKLSLRTAQPVMRPSMSEKMT